MSSGLALVCHCPARNPSSGPCGLKVETAGQAVDIKQFTAKIQPPANAAFHGFEIYLIEAHAAARDKFILVQSFASDLQFATSQLLDQPVTRGIGKIGPAGTARDPGSENERFP